MADFKIGDVVWVRAKVWDRSRRPDRLMLEVGNGEVIAGESDCKPYAEADMKQAITEVLLSDEFMKAFAAAFRSETVSQYTFSDEVRSLEHPIPGVNRPMRSESQLSQMVEMVRQSLTTEPANPSESPNSSPIDEPSNKPKHREPTRADLANGPIECEVSNPDSEEDGWVNRVLVFVSAYHSSKFVTVDPADRDRIYTWPQCRIEVAQ